MDKSNLPVNAVHSPILLEQALDLRLMSVVLEIPTIHRPYLGGHLAAPTATLHNCAQISTCTIAKENTTADIRGRKNAILGL
jgi:hypothetical protein